jgi:hypothetical protein
VSVIVLTLLPACCLGAFARSGHPLPFMASCLNAAALALSVRWKIEHARRAA